MLFSPQVRDGLVNEPTVNYISYNLIIRKQFLASLLSYTRL